ncbi:MAG: hypothetical protein WD576_01445 [Nitriliruptoraceae bacterium]
MNGRRVSLALTIGIAVVLVNGLAATPAHAHTRTAETTNLASVVTNAPELEGVTFTVYTGGFLIGLTNATDRDIIVAGYDGEPYLRIGPDGAFENRHSAATYLNRERYGDVAVPPRVDPASDPDWIRVSAQPSWVWHDHRTHWMSPQPPRFVEASVVTRLLMRARLVGPIGSGGEQQGAFQEWQIPFEHDQHAYVISGELRWIDAPPVWPWYLLAAAFVAMMLGVNRAVSRHEMIGPQRWLNPLANLVVAVAVVNAIHLVDDLAAWPGDLLDELFGLLHTLLFLTAGLVGAFWARYARDGRVLALGIASGALVYHQGLVHLPMLYASQFPTLWPPELVRFSVALGLMQAVPVAWFVIGHLRSHRSDANNGLQADVSQPTVPVASKADQPHINLDSNIKYGTKR